MHDKSGRRGIWFRQMANGDLQMRGGREGADDALILKANEIPLLIISGVKSILSCGAWMQEDEGPNTKMMVAGNFKTLVEQSGYNRKNK